MSALGSLVVKLALEYAQFSQGLQANEQEVKQHAKRVQDTYEQMAAGVADRMDRLKGAVLGAIGGAISAYGLSSAIAKIKQETIDAEKEQQQLAAAIKSTGGAAGWSVEKLNAMADSLEKSSNFSAGQINQAQARMLSYSGVVGDVMPRAMQAVVDMSERMGYEVTASAETIGKALDVPSEGLTALSKQGFRFTEEQKELVKQLERTGDKARAQGIILEALESSYGGAAKAARDTLGGSMQAVSHAINSLMTADSASMPGLRDSIEGLVDTLNSESVRSGFQSFIGVVADIGSFAASSMAALVKLGQAVVEHKNEIGIVLGMIAGAATAAGALQVAAAIGGIGGVAGAVGKLTAAFGALTAVMAANPAGLALLGVGAAVGGAVMLSRDTERQAQAMERAAEGREKWLRSQREQMQQLVELDPGNANYAKQLRAISDELDKVVSARDAAKSAAASSADDLADSMGGITAAAVATGQALGQSEDWIRKYGTAAQKAAIEVEEWKRKLGSAFTPEMQRQVEDLYKKQDAGAKAGAQSAKQLQTAYDGLTKSLAEKIAEQKQELQSGEKLTESDKQRIKFSQDLKGSLKGLSEAQRANVLAQLDSLAALEKEIEARKDFLRHAEEDRTRRKEFAATAEQTVQALLDGNKSLREEIELIGLSDVQQANVLAKRQEAILLIKEQQLAEMTRAAALTGHNSREQLALMQEIELLRERLVLTRDKQARESSASAAAASVQEWQKGVDQIGQSLSDQLMAGGQSFGDYLKNLGRTLVFKPVLQGTMQTVGAYAANMFGGGSAPEGSGLGAINSLSSLYSAFSGGLVSSVGGAIGQLGSLFGSSAISSFATGMKGASLAAGLAGPTTTGAAGAMGMGAQFAAVMPWLAAGLVVAGSWKSLFGRKLKDQGVEGQFGGDAGFEGNSYRFYKGGLFRSDKTERSALDEDLRLGLANQFGTLRSSTSAMADMLGLGTAAIDGFTASIKVSFNGLDDAGVQAALTAEFGKVAESMASLALGTSDYTRTGETALEAITRLSSSLAAANGVFDQLGTTLYASSLAGADMASSLLELFGGADGFGNAAGAFFKNFYSEDEQRAALEKQLNAALAKVDLQLPDINDSAAREQYRALAEAQDLATEAGRKAWATLMQLSGSFAELAQSAENAAQAAEGVAQAADKLAKDNAAADAERARGLRSSLIELGERLPGAGAEAKQLRAEGLAGQVQGLFAGVGIGKDADVLAQQILGATSGAVEQYFRDMWGMLDTDQARQELVDVTGALLDLASSSEAAAQAIADAVAQERQGLEQRWLHATGNTAEMRRRELEALDPSNRALQQMINGLEDAQSSMSDLTAAAQSAAQRAAAAWQDWGTAAGLGATHLGDASGLEARRAILNAQISSATDPAQRLAKLQELIGVEQAIGQVQQANSKKELDALGVRQQALRAEFSAAQQLLSVSKSLGEYVKSLRIGEASGLSDVDRLGALGREYSSLLTAARGGDASAMQRLQGVSSEYLSLSQAMAETGADYAVFAGRVAAELGAVARGQEIAASGQVASYEAEIAQLTQQSTLLAAGVELSEGTKSLIAKSMIDQSEAWDRESSQAMTLAELQQRATDSLAAMPSGIARALDPIVSGAASYLANSVGGVTSAVNALAAMLQPSDSSVPGFASGGLHAGGLRIVGERGWELEATGPARIWNQQQLAKAFGGGSGGPGYAQMVMAFQQLQRSIDAQRAPLERIAAATTEHKEMFDNVSGGGDVLAIKEF